MFPPCTSIYNLNSQRNVPHPVPLYIIRALSLSYEDHKLPSVATRDLEHVGHDSYLAL